jgi:hypothetical protein
MNNAPHITPQIWQRQVRPALNDAGFNDQKLDRIEGFFSAYLNRADQLDRYPGIYADELDKTIGYMRENPDATHFDSHEIDLIDAELRRHL